MKGKPNRCLADAKTPRSAYMRALDNLLSVLREQNYLAGSICAAVGPVALSLVAHSRTCAGLKKVT